MNDSYRNSDFKSRTDPRIISYGYVQNICANLNTLWRKFTVFIFFLSTCV